MPQFPHKYEPPEELPEEITDKWAEKKIKELYERWDKQRNLRHYGPLEGNQSTGTLKLIALVCMICDHAGKMFFPHIPELRIIGRIAFPLYAWCLVVGASYSRNMLMYALRLLIVGAISQPLYMAALNHTIHELNIFFTLALGVGAMWGMRYTYYGVRVPVVILCVLMAQWLRVDYGWKGVLLIIALNTARGSTRSIWMTMVLMCLYWGSSSSVVNELFGYSIKQWATLPILQSFLRLQALAILATPLMVWRGMPNIKLPKWVGYGLYPAHLVVIWVLNQIF